MIKLIASDLDGTLLLNGAQALPEELFELIRELKELGILFVAASGRQYYNMKNLFRPVMQEIGYICENGALALRNEEVLFMDAFDPVLAREIMETIYEKEGAEFTCSTRDFYYIRPKSAEYLYLMEQVIKNECRVIQSFEEVTEPCLKLAVFESRGTDEATIRYWQERFSDRCKVVSSGNDWIDFAPLHTNKANGIHAYREILKIQPEECMVFGDECNDIEMLESVPYSFVMKHSKECVKQHAKYQVERVEPILKLLIEKKGNIEEVIKCITKNV